MNPDEIVSIVYDLVVKLFTEKKIPSEKLASYKVRKGELPTIDEMEFMLGLCRHPNISIGTWFLEPDRRSCSRLMGVLWDGMRYESVHIPDREPFEATARWVPPKSNKVVIKTWLPLYRQKDIAVKLGAGICGLREWQPPENVPEKEWSAKFSQAVHGKEQAIENRLGKLGFYLTGKTLHKGKLNRLGVNIAVRVLHELYILDSYPELYEGWYGKM
jgi:hypothetical protein